MGRKRETKELERRRLRAARLLKRGDTPSRGGCGKAARPAVPSASGPNRWRWAASRRCVAGRWGVLPPWTRPLDETERQKLVQALKRGALAAGYGTGLWTLARVAEMIERLQACGIPPPGLAAPGCDGLEPPSGRRGARSNARTGDHPLEEKALADAEKRCETRPNDRFRGRVRTRRTPHPHLGTEGRDPGDSVPLQLEAVVGDGRRQPCPLLLLSLPRGDQKSTDHRVPQGVAPDPRPQAPGYLGRTRHTPHAWCAPSSKPPAAPSSWNACRPVPLRPIRSNISGRISSTTPWRTSARRISITCLTPRAASSSPCSGDRHGSRRSGGGRSWRFECQLFREFSIFTYSLT